MPLQHGKISPAWASWHSSARGVLPERASGVAASISFEIRERCTTVQCHPLRLYNDQKPGYVLELCHSDEMAFPLSRGGFTAPAASTYNPLTPCLQVPPPRNSETDRPGGLSPSGNVRAFLPDCVLSQSQSGATRGRPYAPLRRHGGTQFTIRGIVILEGTLLY